MTEALVLLLGAGSLGAVAICYRETLGYLRERDALRFERRAEFLRLKAAAGRAEDVEQLRQRVSRLEMRAGVAR